MKTKLLYWALLFPLLLNSQNVFDILDRGVVVPEGHAVYLFYDHHTNQLKYYINANANIERPGSTMPMNDNVIFVPKSSSLSIYFEPFNPLSFSLEANVQYYLDPLDAEFSATFNDAIKKYNEYQNNGIMSKSKKSNESENCQMEFKRLEEIVNFIEANTVLLKPKLIQIFQNEKSLNFSKGSAATTNSGLTSISTEIKEIEGKIKTIREKLDTLEQLISKFSCPRDNKFLLKEILKQILSKSDGAIKEAENLLSKVKSAKTILDTFTAKLGSDWMYPLQDVTVSISNGKSGILAVRYYNDGLKFNDTKTDIIAETKKKLVEANCKVIRYRRMLPMSYSGGTVFTGIQYPIYGTLYNSSTSSYTVIKALNGNFNRFNISAMANYYPFEVNKKEDFKCFLQSGISFNSKTAALLPIGIGINLSQRIILSGGLSMTFVKGLNNLNIGSNIATISDLEKDLIYVPRFGYYFSLNLNIL